MANATPSTRYLVALSITTALAWIASNITHGRIGRMWMAVRDMDIAAELIGIRLLRAKLLAFAVSSYFVGVAGAMMVYLWFGSAEPEAFNIDLSFQLLFIIIIGGLGSIVGAFFGAGISHSRIEQTLLRRVSSTFAPPCKRAVARSPDIRRR